jgi:hypothetical protein
MRRRDFILLLGGAAVAWPRTVTAQQPDQTRRIGVLMELAASDPQARSSVAALERSLHKLGWLEHRNLRIDYRWAPDDAVLTQRHHSCTLGSRIAIFGSGPKRPQKVGQNGPPTMGRKPAKKWTETGRQRCAPI